MRPTIVYSSERVGAKSHLFKLAQQKNSELLRQKTVEEHRSFLRKLAEVRPTWPNVEVRPDRVGGVPCEWITRGESRGDRVILYIHGGSWAFGELRTARPVGVLLSEFSRCTVLVVDYRLSPEHPWPAGLEDCLAVYRALLERFQPEAIGLFGDSAGGNLSLCLMHLLRQRELPFPAALALASPVTDLTEESPLALGGPDLLYTLHQGREQNLLDLYLGQSDRREPTVSPVCGELGGFPPILIHVGEDEDLREDNLAFTQRAALQGVEATCKVWREMFHDFTIVGLALKESRQSLQETAAFLEERMEKTKARDL